MILEDFDNNKIAVLNPSDFQQKKENFPKIVLGFFHHNIIDEFKNLYKPEIIGKITSCTKDFDIYKIVHNGLDIAVIQAPLGAPYCVSIFEEVRELGAKYILIAGSCGCLDSSLEDYSIILPTSAIRDEGTSYHYAEPSQEIELNKDVVSSLENTLISMNINFKKGKTWTTDGLYRETAKKVQDRKNIGAITVEMECSAMTAFAKFRDIYFGELFYASDDLSQEEYDVRSLVDGDISKQAKIIPILIKCAENLVNDVK